MISNLFVVGSRGAHKQQITHQPANLCVLCFLLVDGWAQQSLWRWRGCSSKPMDQSHAMRKTSLPACLVVSLMSRQASPCCCEDFHPHRRELPGYFPRPQEPRCRSDSSPDSSQRWSVVSNQLRIPRHSLFRLFNLLLASHGEIVHHKEQASLHGPFTSNISA